MNVPFLDLEPQYRELHEQLESLIAEYPVESLARDAGMTLPEYTQFIFDAVLRDVAAAGVHVSAHPDAIMKLGTKDVLVDTRAMGWGSDVHRLDTLAQLRAEDQVTMRVRAFLNNSGGLVHFEQVHVARFPAGLVEHFLDRADRRAAEAKAAAVQGRRLSASPEGDRVMKTKLTGALLAVLAEKPCGT